jgi:hypothetical protein
MDRMKTVFLSGRLLSFLGFLGELLINTGSNVRRKSVSSLNDFWTFNFRLNSFKLPIGTLVTLETSAGLQWAYKGQFVWKSLKIVKCKRSSSHASVLEWNKNILKSVLLLIYFYYIWYKNALPLAKDVTALETSDFHIQLWSS